MDVKHSKKIFYSIVFGEHLVHMNNASSKTGGAPTRGLVPPCELLALPCKVGILCWESFIENSSFKGFWPLETRRDDLS
jgi:hypothetical protein